MKRKELQRLAGFSQSVRLSTVIKFRNVPPGKENFQLEPGSLSFADFAQHLLDCDQRFFEILNTNQFVPYPEARPGRKIVKNRNEFENLIQQLEDSQQIRWRLIKDFPEEKLSEMPDDPFSDKITTWWSVLRGQLENEISIRDQIMPSLRKVLIP